MTVNTYYNKLEIKRDLVTEISSIKPVDTFAEIEKNISEVLGENGMVVIWLMNQIIWTKFENGHIMPDEDAANIDYWQEMRAFNDKAEVHLVRIGDSFTGRSIIDKEGSSNWEKGYVDTIAPLWGKKVGNSGDFVNLEDNDRKIHLNIPCADGSANRYGLVTRSYIKTDETTGLSGYVDYRYLTVEGMEV